MFKLVCLVLFIAVTSSSGKVCPESWQHIVPCTCDEYRPNIICNDIKGVWDIKETFNRIEQHINQSTIFEELKIEYTEIDTIPADTFRNLKFRRIYIEGNKNLHSISPFAFDKTYDVTTALELNRNSITNSSIFELCNQFKNVERIRIESNKITSIPENAFDELPTLRSLSLDNNEISKIGKHAFSALQSVRFLYLAENKITGQGLHPEAFSGIGPEVELTIVNNGLQIFEEKYFRTLVDAVRLVKLVYRRCGPNQCHYGDFMTCDSNANWLCKDSILFKDKVRDFLCDTVTDVWDYCENL